MSSTMDARVKKLRQLKQKQEALAAEIKDMQEEIQEQMTAQGVDTLVGSDWKITWKTVTSHRLDSVALKKELPEIAARFMVQSDAKRFLLT